ncbi:MAG: hypothetical protein A3J93_05135 [Candidatus Magasanikbacteria bacterium RIFOXYC2_FULL_42_28]|uniref:Transcription regulator TrmB N-terminal domain-containing protein n=1 Tax=Candidatus Magasanikbacteria bacterium RIFOXYC2_FULL_42_28 TaxID=1798704 RepID=A0A1F6NV94_9BACT|nr:MAG: hypothetical protein A3J93_05135 [Candidatus Magasanikbacteria bacterium RIFOXYC2_FULL_42_28]
MDLKTQLKNADLNDNEADIYLYLLGQGQSTPPQIALGTGIARTNAYNVLRSLQNRGLVKSELVRKRKVYLAADPQALILNWEKQKIDLEKMLPDLRALYTTNKNKPRVLFFDGWEQVKEIYLSSLTTNDKKIYAFGSTNLLSKLEGDFLIYFEQKVKENNIALIDIVTGASRQRATEETKKIIGGMYNFKFLPEKYRDQPTDILIWDNNIALLTLEQPIFGTVITSHHLANTFKIIFELIWEKL